MKTSIIALSVLTALTASTAANASNVDVNHFFSIAPAAAKSSNGFVEAVNAYDNLNARDRMVVDAYADKAGIVDGLMADIKMMAPHEANIPAGWKPELTMNQIRTGQPHPVMISAAPASDLQARFEALKAAKLTQDNIDRTSSQKTALNAARVQRFQDLAHAKAAALVADNITRTASQHTDGATVQAAQTRDAQSDRDDAQDLAIEHAQNTANFAQTMAHDNRHFAEVLAGDIDTNTAKNTQQDKEIADQAVTISGKVEQTEYDADKAAQTAKDTAQDQSVSNVSHTASSALMHSAQNSQRITDNADAIAQNKADQANTDAAQSTLITANTTAAKAAEDKAESAQTTADAANGVAQAAKLLADGQSAREQTANSSRYTAMSAAHVQAVADNTPKAKDGQDGKQGATGQAGKDGADGVTTIKHEVDTKTQKAVAANETAIRGVRDEQASQGAFVQAQSQVVSRHSARIDQNSAQIQRNSQQIDRNKRDIEDTKQDLKRGLNNAAAMTGLHYHSNDSYAISAGTANGDGAALAGGLSHSITEHTAATVQASTSMDGGWMASVGFSGDF